MLKRILILRPEGIAPAVTLAARIAEAVKQSGVEVGVEGVWGKVPPDLLSSAELIICVGGDGTVLRAARLAVPRSLPILGVNMGRLGFLTSLNRDAFFAQVDRILAREWEVEERLMVAATVTEGEAMGQTFIGLNDIVLSRRSPGRPVYVELAVDDERVALYRCDGMIVATPTGSTGYSLSAGGPILAPVERHLVVTPVSAHLAIGRSLVLEPSSTVTLSVRSDEGAILTVDGQEDLSLSGGASVSLMASEHAACFALLDQPSSFFGHLAERLEVQLSSAMNNGD
ncbi:MAG: NAD(+) kinase [Dehalococcoidia bacterium]|nr:NAD(+) kinase [Dehalococcoidia bacterium]